MIFAVIITAVVLLMGAGIAVYIVNTSNKSGQSSVNKINNEAPTKAQVDAGESIKSNNANKGSTGGTDTPPAPTTDPSTGKSTVQISIPSAVNNSTTKELHITTLISDVVNTGTCTLTLSTNGQQPITQTVGVQAQASTSTCKGFTVSTAGLASGTWQITVTFSNDTLAGQVSQAISI